MMKFRVAGILAAIVASVFFAIPANAQATRTWISGVGDDVNPCSRTAPCKTFAGAISKTAATGEIDCLDPGGFGTVTVTKSITLDCGGGIGGQAGSILASGTNGITINGAGILVKVRNLTIDGLIRGSGNGLSGIRFLQGAGLVVEHVGIIGGGGSGSTSGYAGVDFEPGFSGSSNATLNMLDVELQYGAADGVLIKPATGSSAVATLDHVSSMQNAGSGLKVDNTGDTSGNGSNVTVVRSNFSGNTAGVSILAPSGTVPATAMVTDSVISGNSSLGIATNGTSLATARIGSSTVSGNNLALVQGGTSVLATYGDNYVNGNNSAETFSAGAIGKK